jgi:hypothetical protein
MVIAKAITVPNKRRKFGNSQFGGNKSTLK